MIHDRRKQAKKLSRQLLHRMAPILSVTQIAALSFVPTRKLLARDRVTNHFSVWRPLILAGLLTCAVAHAQDRPLTTAQKAAAFAKPAKAASAALSNNPSSSTSELTDPLLGAPKLYDEKYAALGLDTIVTDQFGATDIFAPSTPTDSVVNGPTASEPNGRAASKDSPQESSRGHSEEQRSRLLQQAPRSLITLRRSDNVYKTPW